MMHPRNLIIGLLTVLLFVFTNFDDPKKHQDSPRPGPRKADASKDLNEPNSATDILKQLKKDAELPAGEKDYPYYLKESAKVMAALYYQEMGIKDLAILLRDTGLEPNMTEFVFNKLFLRIRTVTSWPGTRYFKAAFSGDSHESLALDNFSFHYKPGDTSFAEAQEAILNAFDDVGEISFDSENGRAWHLDGGYYIEIRYLTDDEIELGHIENAYTEDDRGSLVITLLKPNDTHGH